MDLGSWVLGSWVLRSRVLRTSTVKTLGPQDPRPLCNASAARRHESLRRKDLLEHVTWQVGDRDRVGLCGPNGAGKTTLLKMLAGFDEPDYGFIQKPNALTLGYLPQDGLSHSGRTVKDEASLALKHLLDLKVEMHDLEERLGDTTRQRSRS